MSYYFLFALQRSGSTLLSYILDSHSQLHMQHEDNGRPFPDRTDKNLYNLQWKIDHGFANYLQNLLTQSNKQHLITSRYFMKSQVELITHALEDQAKFIILTRKHMWRVFHRANGNTIMVPLRRLERFFFAKQFIRQHFPYVEIAYTDMITNPTATFATICDFIGVPFEPAMLEYHNFDHAHLHTRGNAKTRKFTKIIDQSDKEKLSIPMITEAIQSRSRLWVQKLSK